MSERFTHDWLRIREAADADARPLEAVAALNQRFHDANPLKVIDLGAGGGANPRYLAPRLAPSQDWTLIDHDTELLRHVEHAPDRLASAEARRVVLSTRAMDLAQTGDLAFAGVNLVTASALLDLVSAHWIDDVVSRCARHGCTVLFALSYNGCIRWTPADSDDDSVRLAVNAHQTRDKGFGPALGPTAATHAIARLEHHGYRVRKWTTPWRLGPESTLLQGALAEGWCQAATQQAPEQASRFRNWLERRQRRIDTRQSALEVGHTDILGEPPG